MRVLVTGGTGFLGRHIVSRCLKRGYEVRVLSRSKPEEAVEHCAVDLTYREGVFTAVQGCDAVFHVAAKAGIWGAWDTFHAPNVVGTQNIIDACRSHGVRYLVYTSTPSVVFNRDAIAGSNESLPYGSDWLCAYAETKAIAEKKVLESHAHGLLETIALRPHLIWGPGDKHLLPRFIARARAGRLFQIGNGRNRVDITHVYNASEAHLLALDALHRGVGGGKAYFISQGEPVVLWAWIRNFLNRLNLTLPERTIPYPIAYAIGASLETVWSASAEEEPPMTRFLAIELAKDHYFDISAARRDLKYAPHISTTEGLEELYASGQL